MKYIIKCKQCGVVYIRGTNTEVLIDNTEYHVCDDDFNEHLYIDSEIYSGYLEKYNIYGEVEQIGILIER